MSESTLAPNSPPTKCHVVTRGLAYPVRMTLRGSGHVDPLLRAVIELVGLGFVTPQQVETELAALPSAMVRSAVEVALGRGLLSITDDGRLSVPPDTVADGAPERFDGYVVWDTVGSRLLPVVIVGGALPGRLAEDPEHHLAYNRPLRGHTPKLSDIRRQLAALVHREGLPLMRAHRHSSETLVEDGMLDELALVEGIEIEPTKIRLYAAVQFRPSLDGRPNFVFWQPDMSPGSVPRTELWYDWERSLREWGAQTLSLLENRWRATRHEALNVVFDPGEYGSVEALFTALEASLASSLRPETLPETWRTPELLDLARTALREGAVILPGEDAGQPRMTVARTWAAVLESLMQRMLAEAIDVFREGFDGCPGSVEDLLARYEASGLPFQASYSYLDDYGKRFEKDVRKDLPELADPDAQNKLGVSKAFTLWQLAMVANDHGGARHLARIRRLLDYEPEFLALMGALTENRNIASHMRQSSLLADDTVRYKTFRLWRALGNTADQLEATVMQGAQAVNYQR